MAKTTTITCDMCKVILNSRDKYYTIIPEEHNKGSWVAQCPKMEFCPKCYNTITKEAAK
jgi:hypothetical protein